MSSLVKFHRGKEKVMGSVEAVIGDFPPLGFSPRRRSANTVASSLQNDDGNVESSALNCRVKMRKLRIGVPCSILLAPNSIFVGQ